MQATVKKPRSKAAQKNKGLAAFGRLVCFHPRYRLGMEHDFEEPRDFLRALVERILEPKAIVDYLLAGRAEGLELQYSLSNQTWDMIEYTEADGNWEVVDEFPAVQGYIPEIAEAALCELSLEDLYTLARDENAILPVYLPDAASPFLKTSLTAPAWGAGQIGWVYVDRSAVRKKYHGTVLKEDQLMKAEDVLQRMVESCANPRHKRPERS